MWKCPSCSSKLKVSKCGILVCPNCDYEYRSDWRGGEIKRYRCSICLTANDPDVFSMRKIKGKWYHTICLDHALYYLIDNFEFRLNEKLDFVGCKPKPKVTQKVTEGLYTFINGGKKMVFSRSGALHKHE